MNRRYLENTDTRLAPPCPHDVSYTHLDVYKRQVPGLLNFQPVRNYRAAFGMLAGRNALLIALVLLLCAAIAFALFRYPRMPGLARAGLWLVFAGGLSNLYDRLRYGYVIDFLEFDFIRFPVFNVADICVVAGCALAFIALLRADGGKKHV